MTPRQHCDIFVASCHEKGGIYKIRVWEKGECEILSFTLLDRPMYMTIKNNKMYVLLREPFEDESGLVVSYISKEGELTDPCEIYPVKGRVACHLCVDGDNVYTANYLSGSISLVNSRLLEFEGKGVNELRQEMPHPHFITLTPEGKYIAVCDLGRDKITVFTKDLVKISEASVPDGHGVRHLAFSEKGDFALSVNELKSTLTLFKYRDGCFEPLSTVSALPENFEGTSEAAAIRWEKDGIFISNRGANSVTEFKFDGKALSFVRNIPAYGNWPRDIYLKDKFIFVANERSDKLSIIDKQSGNLLNSVNIKAPLCVLSI